MFYGPSIPFVLPTSTLCSLVHFRDPALSVHQMILKADELQAGKEGTSASVKNQEGSEGLTLASFWFLILAGFWFLWNEVVNTLKGDAGSGVDSRADSGVALTAVEQHTGVVGLTLAELSSKWSEVVETLREDGVDVINPGHALEGALSIR